MSTILSISMTFCCWHIVSVSNNACSIHHLKIYLTTFTSGWGINDNIDLSCIVSTSIKIVFQWLVTGRWFSPGTLVSPTNTTDCHDLTEILLKVELNTINLTITIYVVLYYNKVVLQCITKFLKEYYYIPFVMFFFTFIS
jgi:hypothetical protein